MGERRSAKGMDFTPNPIFPLQQGGELFFHASNSSTPPGLQHIDPRQHNTLLMATTPSLDCTDHPSLNLDTKRRGGRRKPSSETPNSCVETSNEKDKKQIMHRDLERQRRQEMTSLYGSLRSLLPIEYLKGKRSISDHMNEAGNYIRDLSKRIHELSDKRDELRKIPNSGDVVVVSGNNGGPPSCVTVQPCWGGVEVVINSGLRNGEFPLSRLLRVLVDDQEFTVISCVSTTVKERSLYTIQSEVSDMTSVDLSGLQQKLTDLIESSSS